MKVMVDGQPTQVFFNYGEEDRQLRGGPVVKAQTVECVIRPFPDKPEDNPVPISTGKSYCVMGDSFDRAKGRFFAWKEAVQGTKQTRRRYRCSKFTREQRQELWGWFISTCKMPDNPRP